MKNKRALITGSTSGIGLGIAESLAQQGTNIILNGLGEATQIEALQNRLAREYSVEVSYQGANLMDPQAITAMMATIESDGGLDILVNNAGIQHVDLIENFPASRWDAVIAINLSSVFHTMQGALAGMKSRNWGRIINIASAHGLVASAQKSAYVAAKHGVVGLTKVAALETAQTGVTVNAICPGWVLTPLVQQQIDARAKASNISVDDAKRDLLGEKQPSLAFVTPEQIGALTCFLCSDAADQIRGASMSVDGGWTAQ